MSRRLRSHLCSRGKYDLPPPPKQEKLPIGLAIQQAQKAATKFRVGAVLFDRTGVLGCGYSHHTDWTDPCNRHSVHAEHAAIVGLRHDIIRGSDMVVVRINKRKEIRPGAPCKKCRNMLSRKGIRKVYYFDRSLDLVSIHL